MNTKKLIQLVTFISLLGLLVIPNLVMALDVGINYGANIGLGEKDPRNTIGDIIKIIISFLGIVAVVIILIGGFRWMTAGGNEEKVSAGRKWIIAGIIGLVIILAAWGIARFVLEQLMNATS